MQAIVREAFQQTVAEQDSEHRGPAEFADAWKARLAALLAQETVEVTGWAEITIAELDTDLGWSLYAAASRARAEAIARAVATPGRRRGADDGPTMSYEFSIAADGNGSLGRVQYAICEPCGVGLLKKISFSPEWHGCGFGTLALRELETRHPGLTWYITGQYAHAKGFYERYRQGSGSPWTEKQHPCPHF
jgi:GNAT superfamily N-acetyltransferase